MTTSRKWLCISSLIVAGLLSLLLSALGGFGLLWGGFPQKDHSALFLAMFLPFLLAFPLFAFAVFVSRPVSLALWIAIPFPALAVFEISSLDFKGGPFDFLKFLAECTKMAWPLLILAALVQFGTQFYEFTHDGQWVRWKKVSNEPTA